MKLKLTLTGIILFLSLYIPFKLCAQVSVQDSLALVNLYDSTGGVKWLNNTGWLNSSVNTWHGVVIDSGRVIALNLRQNNLNGTIPITLGNLSKLQSLILNNNKLKDSILSSLINFSELDTLYMYNNYFTFSGMERIALKYNFAIYSPQATIPLHKNNDKLSVSVGGTLSNNTYTWYKNNIFLTVKTGDSILQVTGNGYYRVSVQNTIANKLTLNSDTILIGTDPKDSLALVDLFNNCGGVNWLNHSGWLNGAVNSWYGVTVDSGRVTKLNLSNNNLTGSLPNSIGDIRKLQLLNLSSNQLNNQIPFSIDSLYKLRQLILAHNQFVNGIPNLSSLLQLDTLDLSYNQLNGSIPATLGTLSNLVILKLNDNELSGNILSSLYNFTKLNFIDLSNNQFTFAGMEGFVSAYPFAIYTPQQPNISIHINGTIFSVDAGGTISNNTYTWYKNGIADTTIKGNSLFTINNAGQYFVTITNSIANKLTLQTQPVTIDTLALDSLSVVDLYNQTNGPNWVNNIKWLSGYPLASWYGITVDNNRITDILFYANNLVGTLPASLGNLTALKTLQLVSNQLSGSIPASLGNLKDLEILALEKNTLTGNIPASLGNLSNLSQLVLYQNQLSGNIPVQLGNLLNLQMFDFTSNTLTGPIPSSLGNLTRLYGIFLGNNQLSNSIPSSLGNLVNLNFLYLYNNQLTGPLPASLGNLTNLEYFLINDNKLSDSIPATLTHSKSIQDMDIQHNAFTFSGMEGLVKSYYYDFGYAPQAHIPIHQRNDTLFVSVGGTPFNNTFEWYKDGALISTSKADSTLKIQGMGRYSVVASNQVCTALLLYSDTLNFGVLAISVVNLNGRSALNGVVLNWKSVQGTNYRFYTIQRSKNGRDFINIEQVNNITNNNVVDYSFTDKEAFSNTNVLYYRLQMTDIDGHLSYSNIISVHDDRKSITAYPNPATNFIVIGINKQQAETTIIQIADMNGKIVLQKQFSLQVGYNEMKFNIQALNRGVYIIAIKGQKVQHVKIEKQ